MRQPSHYGKPHLMAFVLSLLTLHGTAAGAEEVLRVYGSEGPSFAMNEAAIAFGAQQHLRVEVVSGPTDQWLAQATRDADLIYSSAEFMMADFISITELGIDAASVRPLYPRPSTVLVRPGNPKQINDFPDVTKPGVRIMVVSGSGQTGLWEDMAGKEGDIHLVRAFRKNIVLFAKNSTEAMNVWNTRDDIDVWVTWNTWHVPLHDRAHRVHISKDYLIYRQCSIALTHRGHAQPLATRFVDFLRSPEGAQIFESWEWMTTAPDSGPVVVNDVICAVCRITHDEWQDNTGLGLALIKTLLEDYRAMGVASAAIRISAVFQGPAAYWLLKDDAYRTHTRRKGANPNMELIRELTRKGVSIELCAKTMKQYGWSEDDILPEVKIVPGAYQRIIDLELQGYAYLCF